MARPKSVPDDQVHAAIAALYAQGGDKAVTFGSVAAQTGLAPPTLVQRYRSRDGMLEWALLGAWDRLDRATQAAATRDPDKGTAALLKSLVAALQGSFSIAALVSERRSAALQERAERWRARTEALMDRGAGSKAGDGSGASIAFATWQGQLLWEAAGGKGFRLKDALRRLN